MYDRHGRSYAVCGISTDITRQRRQKLGHERLNSRIQLLSDRLARAPLSRIVGFSHILLEDYTERLDDQGKDYLHRVSGSAERMNELLDDLLALSRVAQTDMQSTQVDLSTLANDIVQELQDAEPERCVETFIAPALQVQGDLRLVRIAMENLFSNARKFTRYKGAARIEFCRELQGSETVYLIRDNGAGVDMAYADKLFSAFQRRHDEHEFKGSGIGLATIRRIVRRHNGRVWAEAKPGCDVLFHTGPIVVGSERCLILQLRNL